MEDKKLCKNIDVSINIFKECLVNFYESYSKLSENLKDLTNFISIEKDEMTRDDIKKLYAGIDGYYNALIIEFMLFLHSDYTREIELFRDVCDNAISLKSQTSEVNINK